MPRPGSQAHFQILRHWLQSCDEDHVHSLNSIQTSKNTGNPLLPTRLVDVGAETDVEVWLRETNDYNFPPAHYIALSHPWGPPPHFCTFSSNLEKHKNGIRLDDLPATFRDAVLVTRALKHRYLWIDSICIIQGPDGDFKDESKRMEQVFSAAYCVIAASSSLGQSHSFLRKNTAKERAYVPFAQRGNQAAFYVCEAIDDFKEHVLGGPLNRRGWVLQERALARRTIFFADAQTYWECGDGVRCTTMTKMTK